MKILDKYIIRSFLSPYIISFIIAEFVLVLQFMWKYIDDFAGRGLDFFDFIKLLFYYSITVIPMAVPITILISSVMVYGNLAEKYELSSMKSAGISLIRMMMPGFLIALFTFSFSLFVSNYLKPKSAFVFLETFTTLKRKKPTLNIQEKIFNKDFEGFAIQVNKKKKDGRGIEGVKIYNYNNRNDESYNIVIADHGEIYTTDDGRYFIMKLFNGNQYIEQRKSMFKNSRADVYPLIRTSFDTLEKSFDMSEFDNSNSGSFFSKRRDVMNSVQLMVQIDTFNNKIKSENENFGPKFIKNMFLTRGNSNSQVSDIEKLRRSNLDRAQMNRTYSNTYDQIISKDLKEYNYFGETIDSTRRYELYQAAFEAIGYEKTSIMNSISSIDRYKGFKNYWEMGLHQQYSWALICIVFLFIGAPLGSIIRKGGYGYPVLIAILFFMVFILLSISGDKFSKSNHFNSIFNAWLPVIVLFPVSILLTIKALKDSKFSTSAINLLNIFNQNKNSDS